MDKETKAATVHVPGAGADDAAEEAKWGTRHMGAPADPSSHPDNQRAALWCPRGDYVRPPYVLDPVPVSRPPAGGSPMESILDLFNSSPKTSGTITAPSKTEAALGKLSLTAKVLTEGGFETLYKQTFPTEPHEKLKKTFACYLSTTTGPVAGTLYLSNPNIAFCSDRPLWFKAPSGHDAWSYYKVKIPLAKIETVIPVTLSEDPPRKYIQIVTVDGHDFWFMGFVHYYHKAVDNLLNAVDNLLNAVSDFRAAMGGGAQNAAVPRVVT